MWHAVRNRVHNVSYAELACCTLEVHSKQFQIDVRKPQHNYQTTIEYTRLRVYITVSPTTHSESMCTVAWLCFLDLGSGQQHSGYTIYYQSPMHAADYRSACASHVKVKEGCCQTKRTNSVLQWSHLVCRVSGESRGFHGCHWVLVSHAPYYYHLLLCHL